MTINIRMHGNFADEELRSLYTWLLDEPDIRQHADVRLVAEELQAGEMGTVLDVISLVATSVIGLPGVIETVRGWRNTRRRKPEITIERGGIKATFSDTDPEAVIKILDAAGED